MLSACPGSSIRGSVEGVVEGLGDGGESAAECAQVGALGQARAQQPIGLLVGAALPGCAGLGEVDQDAGVAGERSVLNIFLQPWPAEAFRENA